MHLLKNLSFLPIHGFEMPLYLILKSTEYLEILHYFQRNRHRLEGLMLQLKLQYFGHRMQRTGSLEKTDAGKDWRHEEKGTTDDEMVEWHHWLDGQEFEQAPAVGDGQGSVACCSSWGHKESDMTEWLNWIISHMTLGNLNYDSCDWGTEFLVVFNCNHFKCL